MGSCSFISKSSNKQGIKSSYTHPKITHLTPVTGDHCQGFDSLQNERSDLFSSFFAAHGNSPFESEDPFCEKPISFKGKEAANFFTNNKISITCRKGLKVSPNQDNLSVVSKPPVFCAGIFTGLGENGHILAALAQKTLPEILIDSSKLDLGAKSKVFQCFCKSGQVLAQKCEKSGIDLKKSEVFGTFALITNHCLAIGLVGDNKTLVLRREKSRLKPMRLRENNGADEELGKNGLYWELDYGKGNKLETVWKKDKNSKGVVQIESNLLMKNDEFLVLASSTVWDVLGDEEIAEILEKYESDCAGNYIANLTWSRWIEKGFDEFGDISVIIVPLD